MKHLCYAQDKPQLCSFPQAKGSNQDAKHDGTSVKFQPDGCMIRLRAWLCKLGGVTGG